MMDNYYGQAYRQDLPKKKNDREITAKLNGNSCIFSKEKFKDSELKNFDKFVERLIKSLKLKVRYPSDVRLFNLNGLELYEQDLPYLKNDDTIYVSMGENFDLASYYSEYKITDTLGCGGFGKVMLGVHQITEEKVAIKITNAEAIGDIRDIDNLFAESETLKSLKHPNIVKILN